MKELRLVVMSNVYILYEEPATSGEDFDGVCGIYSTRRLAMLELARLVSEEDVLPSRLYISKVVVDE